MTYEEAQLLIDDKSQNDALTVSLRGLNNLAKKLKKRRLENGYFLFMSILVIIYIIFHIFIYEKFTSC